MTRNAQQSREYGRCDDGLSSDLEGVRAVAKPSGTRSRSLRRFRPRRTWGSHAGTRPRLQA